MKTWYTSDLHIDHQKVAVEVRGFETIEAHNACLAARWDELVHKDDFVYVVGDISSGTNRGQLAALEWIYQRPGTKILIPGNHDRVHGSYRDRTQWETKYFEVFKSITQFARIKVLGEDVLISHFPYPGFDREYGESRMDQYRLPDYGEWLLHGHTHSKVRRIQKMIHIGVDAWDFYPVAHTTIVDMIEEWQNALS